MARSLLDLVLAQRNPQLANMLRSGPNSILARRDQMAGLFSDAAPVERSIFEPGPAPTLPQLQAAAAAAPAGPAVDPQQVMQAQRELLSQLRQQAVGMRSKQIANVVARVTGGDVPPVAVPWVREAAEDDLQAAPGTEKQSIIARIFLGDTAKGLSESQQKNLWRHAMLISGLSLLGNRGHDGPSVGQALAMGILSAREQATRTAGQLLDEQRAQARLREREQVFANSGLTDIEKYEELQRIAAREGDAEQVKILDDVLRGLREAQANELDRTVQVVDGRPIAFDRTGAAFDPFTGEQLAAAQSEGKLTTIDTPNGRITVREMPDGSLRDPFTNAVLRAAPQPAPAADEWHYDSARGVQVNKRTGQVRQLEGLPERAGAGSMRDTVLTGMVGPNIETVRNYIREHGAPLRGTTRLPRELQSADLQEMQNAGELLARTYVFLLSGVTARQDEVDAAMRSFLPQPGDKKPTLDAKLRRLAEFEALVRDPSKWHPNARAAGGVAPDAGTSDDEDEFGFGAFIPAEGGR